MTEFDARAVAYRRDEELGAAYLVLAEHEHGSGRRIEVQRPLIVADDDRRLRTDTYCLVNDGGLTHYGGVEGWSIEDSTLELRLDQKAARVLGVEGGYRIHLTNPETIAAVVKNGLEAILRSG